MFKLRSMSGYIIFRCGGPIIWKAVRQECTSLSSCEAEVWALNECAKATLFVRLLLQGLSCLDPSSVTIIHNNNHACVDWCKSTTTKGMKHLNLRENFVRESVIFKEVAVCHIVGATNVADLFTKELSDGAHFRAMRDSFMRPWPSLLQ